MDPIDPVIYRWIGSAENAMEPILCPHSVAFVNTPNVIQIIFGSFKESEFLIII